MITQPTAPLFVHDRALVGARRLCLSLATILWLGSASPASAETAFEAKGIAPAAPVTPVTAPANIALPPTVIAAAQAWREAVNDTPKLVSLFVENKGAGFTDITKTLKARLRVLGDKTFSNREWRNYWTMQARTADGLAKAVVAAKLPLGDAWASGLKAWVALAHDKETNQDIYLDAIERERDALEERLEATMEPEEHKPTNGAAAKARAAEDPNPYMKRTLHLADLERRIELQTAKRAVAQTDLKLINAQLSSAKILHGALAKDVALARRELEVARAEQSAATPAPWRDLWRVLVQRAEPKVVALKKEADLEAAHQRASDVEAGLTTSQIKFRTLRISQLSVKLERDSGARSWFAATRDTFIDWITNRAWRILIGLILVWIGLRVALRLVQRGADAWIRRAEGDPDDTADDDLRAVTLATVFSGVSRIALYIIAALLALDGIGVDTGPLLGSVAILGLAISFGSQNLVRDVVNGFFILVEDQFAVGDFVEVGGKSGTVERITIRSTWIRQGTGELHAVPNGSITTVTNMTRDWARARLEVGVAYDADLAYVRTVCEQIGVELSADEAWSDKLLAPLEFDGVTGLADSWVNVRISVKTRPGDQWSVGRELNRRVKLGFDAAGIEIPFPQRVMWQRAAS